MYKGGCLCGKVRFEITGEIKSIIYCHCSKCRKAQGSAFATNGNLEEDKFHIISGRDDITGYESSLSKLNISASIVGHQLSAKINQSQEM